MQASKIEDVGEALAHGLQHDRELRILGGDGQQLSRAHSLLPQR